MRKNEVPIIYLKRRIAMMNRDIFKNRCLVLLASLVLLTFFSQVGQSAEEGSKPTPPAVMKQVAPDLYFHFDYDSSNSIIWATEEGVLVIDTRQHPRGAKELVEKIRKITDKPIRWAAVTLPTAIITWGIKSSKSRARPS
jgi:hypothetical protein